MGIRKWNISKPDKEKAAELAEVYGFPSFLALLLVTRGMNTPEEIGRFLSGDEWEDPFQIRDMDQAVARIEQALDSEEAIVVYGDYDADGVTATALLYSYLESCGYDVRYYIPTREGDGYGLNRNAIDQIAKKGCRLIITVDNGISSVNEIAYAKSLGIDTVVTDHHTPPEILPDAVAVVDPHRADCPSRFKDLCGVGVAFKLVTALERDNLDVRELLEHFADLAAVGTIGDIVPLLGENRLLVREGLKSLRDSDRLGLRILMQVAGLTGRDNISAGNLSFQMVPRINAMGRLGSSERAVRLFLTDYEEEAQELAEATENDNQERQKLEQEVFVKASEQLAENPRKLMERILIVWGEGWHQGVLGIVASRLSEKYGKPSIVIGIDGEDAVGSCRSLSGFSIVNALTACSHLLQRYGGHTLAAGFSVQTEKLELLYEAINRYVAETSPEMPLPTLNVDCKLNPAGITPELVDQIRQMEPFGAGNPTPVFVLSGMKLTNVHPVGGNKHLRLTVSRNDTSVTVMLFRTTPEEFPYSPGEELDFAVTLEKSSYRGEDTVSVIARDVHPAGLDVEQMLREKQRYERYVRGELDAREQKELLPDRRQLAAIYRIFRAEQNRPRPVEYWCSRLQKEQIGYDKLMTGLIAMRQMKLLQMRREADVITVSLLETEGKVNLEEAPILKKLRQTVGVV